MDKVDTKFDLQKKRAMLKLEVALREKKVDKGLISFLKKFNKKKFYYTTSSCAGRIILLHDLGSKKDSYFVSRWHRKVTAKEVIEAIENFINTKNANKGILWFKQEPIIMHIVCYSLEKANDILAIAMKWGLKHSGAIAINEQRYVVEINGNERMSVPIVHNKLLIDKQCLSTYIRSIVEIANKNFMKNQERRRKFLSDLLHL